MSQNIPNNSNKQSKNRPDVKIIIAAHKKYRMPQDDIYLPLHVGAEGKESIGYQGDNTGNNISSMNPYFCELTGLYWMWKNLNADNMGLAHYRRHFCYRKKKGGSKEENKWASVLNSDEAQNLCAHYDVIVPSKRYYVIETLASHYAHTHYKEHLDKTREIVKERYPQCLKSYDKELKRTSGYMFNMFIMRADLVDEYCSFLFDILFELDKKVDTTGYSAFQARYPGRIGEILFNVWLDYKRSGEGAGNKEQGLRVKELQHIHMEQINWWNKGTAFLKAKFLGKRYEHGF